MYLENKEFFVLWKAALGEFQGNKRFIQQAPLLPVFNNRSEGLLIFSSKDKFISIIKQLHSRNLYSIFKDFIEDYDFCLYNKSFSLSSISELFDCFILLVDFPIHLIELLIVSDKEVRQNFLYNNCISVRHKNIELI